MAVRKYIQGALNPSRVDKLDRKGMAVLLVNSWRGTTAPQVQADMDRLFEAAMSLAKGLLSKYCQFLPVSIRLDADGQQRVVTADPGPEADVRGIHDLIYRGMRSHSEIIRCVAVATDVRIGGSDPTDAIRIHLEHRDGPSVVVYAPYTVRRRLRGRDVQLGELQAGPDERRVW